MINTGSTDILEAIADDLRANWQSAAPAQIIIAEDPAHAMDIMRAVKPGSSSVVLFYTADAPVEQDCPGDVLVDATIRMAVVQHPGLKLASGSAAPTVMQAIDSLRKHVINIDYTNLAGGRLEYRGMSYLATEDGMLIHGYALTYSAIYAFDVA